MKTAIEHYEAALKEAFPSGATGDVFHHWNEARKALEQPAKDAPVAWATQLGEYAHIQWGAKRPEYPMVYEFPLYTRPQARKWVGLTDEERQNCTQSPFTAENYRAIEAKLREKNA